ncbi:Schizosaccharomyces specific protein Mug103 [Schizosaccharomyces pombe]|uniref:Meiotically up-regulated gene 103 protein n=1 Tax=Schizosaccharomyces pombe (strain 972 / ATCC 24843) TaxID=284812 RepID=MU103_SCHPO|nr:protein mug103 [Schizosaccharomyces pombe]O13894.1 RecName: Full=Meiotically up-regulated gene 103 protein [Schizosaccharomyces pombe 972h-]CAB16572.1 sequence orphan [Schizosaccharomyces pombe]|eukprot:NP_593232.1 protein mug103 [Schizosaccharomyces pombe]
MEQFEIIRESDADPYYFNKNLRLEECEIDGFTSIYKAPPPYSFVAGLSKNTSSNSFVIHKCLPPLQRNNTIRKRKRNPFLADRPYCINSEDMPLSDDRDMLKERHVKSRKLLLKEKGNRFYRRS